MRYQYHDELRVEVPKNAFFALNVSQSFRLERSEDAVTGRQNLIPIFVQNINIIMVKILLATSHSQPLKPLRCRAFQHFPVIGMGYGNQGLGAFAQVFAK